MLGVTRLLCESERTEEGLGSATAHSDHRLLQFSREKRPVVVWNVTRRCTLRCLHCYSGSGDRDYPGELTTDEGFSVIDDLAGFGVPVIIFSGGDPLLREDIFELARYARTRGIRPVLSTNGVLIDRDVARAINGAGFAYAGVSLDGTEETNDRFRAVKGCFERALKGLRHLRDEGVRTGIRFTMSKMTIGELPAVFDLAEKECVPRLYISHLVYSGRGERIKGLDLDPHQRRRAVDYIFARTQGFHIRGIDKDVLTGNNDADGVYLYLGIKKTSPGRAESVYRLLKARGGNSSGTAIGCIDHLGNVHADQFFSGYSFGNVKKTPFSKIWTDTGDPVMKGLKEKTRMVKGRCAQCRYLEICCGNSRVRAEAHTGDLWAEDPSCYLTDEEIGLSKIKEGGGVEGVAAV